MYRETKSPTTEDAQAMSSQAESSRSRKIKDGQEGEDKEATQIITGTVITACLIQTSALPNRVEMEGNDITFYDDTYEEDGVVKGDTSRLVFFSSFRDDGHFIMEKRASINDTYDNVLSWYYTPPLDGKHNWLFIGRNGDNSDPQRNTGAIYFAVNGKIAEAGGPANGVWGVEVDTDGVIPNFFGIITGISKSILGGPFTTGFSTVINSDDGGAAGIAYANQMGLYQKSINEVTLGLSLIPDANNAYDIGTALLRIKTIYTVNAVNVSSDIRFKENIYAIEDGLNLIKKITPISYTRIGEDKMHYGFSAQELQGILPNIVTEEGGQLSITPDEIVPVLLKALKELAEKVDELEAKLK